MREGDPRRRAAAHALLGASPQGRHAPRHNRVGAIADSKQNPSHSLTVVARVPGATASLSSRRRLSQRSDNKKHRLCHVPVW